MKISVVNMDVIMGDREANYKKIEKFVSEAIKEHPDAIVIPELFDIGFFPKDNLISYGDDNGEKAKDFLGNLARLTNTNIVGGSVLNRQGDEVYNTSYIFNRAGEVIGEYSKTHLFTPSGEKEYFKSGNEITVFEIDGVKCGVVICYDLRFPELARLLALREIKVLFVVAQWGIARREQLNLLAKTRAVENQIYVALADSCGEGFAGDSAIFSPSGDILEMATQKDSIVSQNVNVELIEDIKSFMNIYEDRRVDLYKLTTNSVQ